jgi:hypothetical protein
MAKEKSNRMMITLRCSLAIFPHTHTEALIRVLSVTLTNLTQDKGNPPYSNSHEIDVVEDKIPFHYRCSPRTNHL